MRIVQLNPFYFPYAGGIERRIRAVAQRLAARGHEAHIVTARQPGTVAGASSEGAVTVHRLPSRFPLRRFYNPPPVLTPGVGAYVDALRPDVVDGHFRWSPGYNRAFRTLRAPGKVATLHNTFGEGTGALAWASRLNDRLYLRTLRQAGRIACVSGFVLEEFARHGAPRERMRVSWNAVDPLPPPPSLARPPAAAAAGPYAVAVSRLVPLKGIDLLIEAWRQVQEPVRLVVVGDGPDRARLQRLARRHGVEGRLHFTGWVEEPEKRALLRGALAYLHPSRFEAFGLSILEAMAEGVPVVCSGVGGIPEAVGDAGPLLGRDPAAWAREVDLLAGDDGLRRRRGAASLRRSRLFDWDRVTAGLEQVYREAADDPA